MLSEYLANYEIDKSGALPSNISNTLLKNKIGISKQLLNILKANPGTHIKPGEFTAEELEIMLTDYETYWNDSLGRGDIEAELADKLPHKIIWITKQLIEMMKPQCQ